MEKTELICKSCKKKITLTNMPGAELLAITSVIGHIMTCKGIKDEAGKQEEGIREFVKIFFELKEN